MGGLTLYFQLFIYYAKEGVNTFDDAYVDYLLTAKQKSAGFCEHVLALYLIV